MRLKDQVRLKLHAAAAADEDLRVIMAAELAFVIWWNAQVRARADMDAWHQARRAVPTESKEPAPNHREPLDGARGAG